MLGQAVRRFTTSAVRASHYAEGPGQWCQSPPGLRWWALRSFLHQDWAEWTERVQHLIDQEGLIQERPKNLPFSVENKWKLLGMMVLFFGSGFAFPFVVVRHQILKK